MWHIFPYFTPGDVSWEGHLSGAVSGALCSFGFANNGPQRPDPFKNEEEEETLEGDEKAEWETEEM